jgi:putative hemolysin
MSLLVKEIEEAKKFLVEKGLGDYKPHFSFEIEKGPYLIKVAETPEELIETFELRYGVYGPFYKTPPRLPLDIDDYDKLADHIIVINKDKNKVVGTYRVLSSDFTDSFYTAREFNIDGLVATGGKLVEMGRATVSTEARSGAVITLLWRGLGEYISNCKAEYLFGCATLWTQDFNYVSEVWSYFKEKDLFFEKDIFPLEQNQIPNWKSLIEKRAESEMTEDQQKEVSKSLPPLFKSYIKAGAKFGNSPANDVKLQSVDFFTVCKVSELSDNLIKKYL